MTAPDEPKKPKSKGGRPSRGICESRFLLRAPQALLAAMAAAAAKEELNASEWLRRAISEKLHRQSEPEEQP